jgi:hypothetical protein
MAASVAEYVTSFKKDVVIARKRRRAGRCAAVKVRQGFIYSSALLDVYTPFWKVEKTSMPIGGLEGPQEGSCKQHTLCKGLLLGGGLTYQEDGDEDIAKCYCKHLLRVCAQLLLNEV